MSRANLVRVLGALLATGLASCSDATYVIGRAPDAGRPDAAIVDACDAHQDALACASFEDDDVLSGWDDSTVVEGGALEHTTARAHGGMGALHASSTASMSTAVVTKSLSPVSSGELFLRLYLYVPSGLPTEIMNIVFIGDVPQPDPFIGLDINVEDGALQVFSPQASPSRRTSDAQIPRDRWFCLQARIDLDAKAVALLVDGMVVLEASGLGEFASDGVRELRVGIDWSSEQEELFEVYVDDVLLDDVEVSCQ